MCLLDGKGEGGREVRSGGLELALNFCIYYVYVDGFDFFFGRGHVLVIFGQMVSGTVSNNWFENCSSFMELEWIFGLMSQYLIRFSARLGDFLKVYEGWDLSKFEDLFFFVWVWIKNWGDIDLRFPSLFSFQKLL